MWQDQRVDAELVKKIIFSKKMFGKRQPQFKLTTNKMSRSEERDDFYGSSQKERRFMTAVTPVEWFREHFIP